MKIAFFDIDGTLCNSRGEVLPSTKHAIQMFRDEGNLTYLCTGRSKPEIIDSILEVGFDGIIGSGGGYVVMDEEVIRHQTIPETEVLKIIAFFDANDIGYYLESNDGLFGSQNCRRKIEESVKRICKEQGMDFETENAKVEWFYELIAYQPEASIKYDKVNKISFINDTLPFTEIVGKFGESFHLYHSTVPMFGPESGEIAVKGIDKKDAIELVLAKLGLQKSDAMAFGDGDNDLAMFEAVGYKIAMANGTVKLKSAADEITLSAEEDGIAQSFKRQNWRGDKKIKGL